jgi:flagellar hook-length control protein FliK
MNIDRQGTAGALRIDKGVAAFARVPAGEDQLAGLGVAAVSFSSVLAEFDPVARPEPGRELSDAAAIVGLSGTVLDQTAPPDPGAWLAQGMTLASGARPDPDSSLSGQPSQSCLVPDAALATEPAVWLAQTMAATLGARPDSNAPLTRQSDAPVLSGLPPLPVAGGMDTRPKLSGAAYPTPVDTAHAAGGAIHPLATASGKVAAPPAESFDAAAIGLPTDPKTQPARRRSDPGQQVAPAVLVADAGATATRAEVAAAAEQNMKSDWRSAFAAQADRVASSANPALGEGVGGFKPLAGLRDNDRQPGRSLFVPLDGVSGGAGAASAYSTNATSDPGTIAGTDVPFAAGSSSEVAQKVHYWITRGVQSAELQLEAFGGSAVDISISMQGNEAQVEFRSDQPEARRMLQDAMPQLRELLRSEGLELSGGFVGTSAQQDPQPKRDGTDTPRSRTGVVTVAARDDTNSVQRPVGQARALDIFV